jgi:hypothetical protein
MPWGVLRADAESPDWWCLRHRHRLSITALSTEGVTSLPDGPSNNISRTREQVVKIMYPCFGVNSGLHSASGWVRQHARLLSSLANVTRPCSIGLYKGLLSDVRILKFVRCAMHEPLKAAPNVGKCARNIGIL